MAQINVTNLSFSYEGSYDNIFENASFTIDTRWKLGFIGRNGRGKTTFLRLLTGACEYSGKISSPVSFDYFPYEVDESLKSLNTAELAQKISPGCEPWRVFMEISLLGMEEEILDRPFATLSEGEKTRVLLAALFARENNFLLIDEPTNHLDIQAREAVEEYLKAKQGFILVSHDRRLLDNVVDHILSINRADIQVQKGNYSTWSRNKELSDSHELAENERLRGEIGRLTEAARRSAQWSDNVEKTKCGTRNSGLRPDRGYIGARSAAMMKRSKAAEARKLKAAEEKSGLLKNIESADSLRMEPLQSPQKRLIHASGLCFGYGNREVFKDLDFDIQRGDRLAVTGKNGSGKTSLIKLLAGLEAEYQGELSRFGSLIISWLPQDSGGLRGSIDDFAREGGTDPGMLRSVLRKLDFPRVQFEKDISSYSAGQRKKLLLARSMLDRAHLYLWDEPLNYVDIISRKQVEDMILLCEPTMVFIEHDRAFVENVATKTLKL